MPPDWPSALSLPPLLLPSMHCLSSVSQSLGSLFPSILNSKCGVSHVKLWSASSLLRHHECVGPRFGPCCMSWNSKPVASPWQTRFRFLLGRLPRSRPSCCLPSQIPPMASPPCSIPPTHSSQALPSPGLGIGTMVHV